MEFRIPGDVVGAELEIGPDIALELLSRVFVSYYRNSFVRSYQSAISMGFRARLAGSQFTFFARFGAASWAPYRQSLFLGGFHYFIMRRGVERRWSILTSDRT
jgi:hypothetical protein